jgi:tetratricopeptide (TPR) repeat protein
MASPRSLVVEELRASLLALPRGRQLTCAINLRRYKSRPFCEYLLQHSWAIRFADPAGMLWEARVARSIADALKEGDLRVHARVNLANALRICGRFSEAERALAESLGIAPDRLPDAVEAQRFAVLASLRFAQGRAEEGERAIRKAIELSECSRDLPRLAALLIQLSLIVAETDPATGLRLASRALRLLGPDEDRLRLIAHHNACEFLCILKRPEPALRIVEGLAPLYDGIGEPAVQARRFHLLGKIGAEMKLLRLAEERYAQAISLYRECDQPHMVAVASLELGALLCGVERSSDREALVRDALSCLDRLNSHAPVALDLRMAMTTGRLRPEQLSAAAASLQRRVA